MISHILLPRELREMFCNLRIQENCKPNYFPAEDLGCLIKPPALSPHSDPNVVTSSIIT